MASLSSGSRVSGRILLDGHERRSWASRLVAYVPQNDFLLPTLTVAETLRYSAQLRLPRGTSASEVQVCSRSVPARACRLRPGHTVGIVALCLLWSAETPWWPVQLRPL